jgi:CDGSH iron-sulfur domain-containing protein 3
VSEEKTNEVKILVKPHGSLKVNGKVTIIKEDGTEVEKEGLFSLCRCGATKDRPFCDGSHRDIGF